MSEALRTQEPRPRGKAGRRPEFVYFVEAETSRLIKIGVARDMTERLRGLQTGSPDKLRVIALIRTADPERLEQVLHLEFRDTRQHGEWFKPSPELVALIATRGRTLKQDEQDQHKAKIADWTARGIISSTAPKARAKGNRLTKLARYKLARGIA